MRKTAILVFLVVAGLAFGASATWKTKPYQQWNANDVKEVLTNSPWVKHTTVTATWKKSLLSGDTGVQDQQNPTSPAGPPRPGAAAGSTGGAQSNNQQQPSMAPPGSEVPFLVRWSSSVTVREAVARDAVLNGHSSEAQAEQYVGQAPTAYQILVYGMDMTPFTDETNDTLKSKAYIEVKSSKEKLAPSSVEIVKDPDGKKIESVLFSFPRQNAGGQPVFTDTDKQARFDCKLKDLHLDTEFDLRKMIGKNGPDL